MYMLVANSRLRVCTPARLHTFSYLSVVLQVNKDLMPYIALVSTAALPAQPVALDKQIPQVTTKNDKQTHADAASLPVTHLRWVQAAAAVAV
jgi:hypothetical protein